MPTIVAIWQFVFNISNAAITNLLQFLKYFLLVVGLAFWCGQMQHMGDNFLVTIHSLWHLINLQEDDFVAYVVCPKCDSIYNYNDFFEIRHNGLKESKFCSHVSFPSHPQRSRGKVCGATLLKKIKTKHGYSLSLIRCYPYKPIK